MALGLVEELAEASLQPVEALLQLGQFLEKRDGFLATEGGYPGREHDDRAAEVVELVPALHGRNVSELTFDPRYWARRRLRSATSGDPSSAGRAVTTW